ncbi:hypothetical protein AWENTII_009005 [Aspergillus wentii]
MPALFHRDFDLSPPKWEFSDQWTNPSDIFTALLILGGDGVEVAKAVDSLLGVALSQLLFRSLDVMLEQKFELEKTRAERKVRGSSSLLLKPTRAGLCVAVYQAGPNPRGYTGRDLLYY